MGEKPDRDIEKVYSTSEFVAKLRRLADALGPSSTSSTSGRGMRKNSSFNSSGPTRKFFHHAVRSVPWEDPVTTEHITHPSLRGHRAGSPSCLTRLLVRALKGTGVGL
jgi:hypothetical protein